jgi:hypothetical protein
MRLPAGLVPTGTVGAMPELVVPWLPEGRLVRVEGRGELFARIHRHTDPDAPVVLLLHGWTASVDLQFVTAYEALAVVGGHELHVRRHRSPRARARAALAGPLLARGRGG